jgi:hypothetical protein
VIIDTKILNQYWWTEFNNTSKTSCTMTKLVAFRDANL